MSCGPPPTDVGIEANCTGTTFGETCSFSCGAGFDDNAASNTSITCQANGQWTMSDLVCTVRDCGTALPVSASSTEASTNCSGATTVGAQCSASCNSGFSQTAGTVADYECDESGSWVPVVSGGAFECVAITCDPAIGTGDASDFVCPSAAFGEECTVECNEGYNTSSSTPFTCDDSGAYTGGSFTCEIVTCGALPVSGDGVLTECPSDEYLDVSTVEHTVLTGPRTRVAHPNLWLSLHLTRPCLPTPPHFFA